MCSPQHHDRGTTLTDVKFNSQGKRSDETLIVPIQLTKKRPGFASPLDKLLLRAGMAFFSGAKPTSRDNRHEATVGIDLEATATVTVIA